MAETSGVAVKLRAAFPCLLFLLSAPIAVHADNAPRIAIIIDDLGYQLQAGRRAINLPGPVACAVLPQTPQAVLLAEDAFDAGKDVLLHLPLQSMTETGAAEPGSIVLETTRHELATSFRRSMASVPHAVGVSNHRGSLLTQHPGHMDWLMQEIEAQGELFFVDSYTTHRSVALDFARENGIPAVKRDVFLDPDRSLKSLEREFERLKRLARSQGMAVGIGHPYPQTLAFLERELPDLADQGFELVGIGDYISDYVAGNTAAAYAAGHGAPVDAAGD